MLVMGEKHGDVNVVHIVLGAESEFQLNMSGHIVADISDNIDKQAEKNFIFINKCESEMELQMQMTFFHKQFKEHMEKKESDSAESQQKNEENSSDKKSNTVNVDGKSRQTNKKLGIFYEELRCPDCKSHGVWVKDGSIFQCSICQKIDEGLENKDIPEDPTSEQSSQTLKELLDGDESFRDLYQDYRKRQLDLYKEEDDANDNI